MVAAAAAVAQPLMAVAVVAVVAMRTGGAPRVMGVAVAAVAEAPLAEPDLRVSF